MELDKQRELRIRGVLFWFLHATLRRIIKEVIIPLTNPADTQKLDKYTEVCPTLKGGIMAKVEIDQEALKALLNLTTKVGRTERVAYVLEYVGADRYEKVAWTVRSAFLEWRSSANAALHCLRRAWAKAFPELPFPGAPKGFLTSRLTIEFHDAQLRENPQIVFQIAHSEGLRFAGSITYPAYIGMHDHKGWTRLY